MTYQGDPNAPRDPNVRRRPQDYVRREDGSWSALPIVLGLVLLFGLGYMFFGSDGSRTDDPSATKRIDRPAVPPAANPAPTTPAPNKQP